MLSNSNVSLEVSLNNIKSTPSGGDEKKSIKFYCCICKTKMSKFECIDCISPACERSFCNDCYGSHSSVNEFSGHILLPLVRKVGYRNKRCEHGREKRDCVSCGGSRVCQHQRLQRSCRECGGNTLLVYIDFKISRHTMSPFIVILIIK